MADFGSQSPSVGEYLPPVLCNTSRYFLGKHLQSVLAAGSSWVPSTVAPTANQAYLYPFALPKEATVTKLSIANGAAPSGNVDMGIYDENFSKLVSSGAVARSGANVYQDLDITDTLLAAGRYYLAFSVSTAVVVGYWQGLPGASTAGHATRGVGIVEMAAAHPLPSVITPAVPTTSNIFDLLILLRATP